MEAKNISPNVQQITKDLVDKGSSVFSGAEGLAHAWEADVRNATSNGISISFETETYILKKSLEALQFIANGAKWKDVKTEFDKLEQPEQGDRIASIISKYTDNPSVIPYLTQNGPEPTNAPALATQTPVEMSPMETLNKLMDTLAHEFVSDIQHTREDTRRAKKEDQAVAMNKTLEECSKKIGISKENLQLVVDYLQRDPSAVGKKYQKTTQKCLDKVLQAMAEHTPKGEIDRATLDAWKNKVEEAKLTLEKVQESWNTLSAAKDNSELRRTECETKLDETIEVLSKAQEKLQGFQTTLSEKQAELAEQEKDASADLSELKNEIEQLKADITEQESRVRDAQDVVDIAKKDLREARAELKETEFALKQKSFEVQSAMMVCALQERMSDAIQHMPLLDDKVQEGKELAEDIDDLTEEYERLAQQYKGLRIALGESLQQNPLNMIQNLGDALVDWKMNSIQKHNEKDIQREVKRISRSMNWHKFTMNMGGIVNKTSNGNINLHTNKAMKELAKVNKLDARIKKQTERMEKQAIRHIRREHAGQRLTKAAIEQSPEYKAKLKELVDARTASTREKRAVHVQKFQKQYALVQDRIQRRESLFKKDQERHQRVEKRIKGMRDMDAIRDNVEFKKHTGFDEDLKRLLKQSSPEINKIRTAAEKFAQENTHDDGPSFGNR